MRVVGELLDDAPLIIVAVEEEAVAFPAEFSYLCTGPGKVAAAIATSWALSQVRPSVVVNIGTAGALHKHLEGLHQISSVMQHDLDVDALEAITGRTFERVLQLGRPGLRLVTGDVFVADPMVRDQLAQSADLVDMEGYAVAAAAAQFGVDVQLIKYVSDTADETAALDWPRETRLASQHLAEWLATSL
jgi:adenosylhomocysteine nucleosidase